MVSTLGFIEHSSKNLLGEVMLKALSNSMANQTGQEKSKIRKVFLGSALVFWIILLSVYYQFETVDNTRRGLLLVILLPFLPILSLVEGFFRLILPHEKKHQKSYADVWRIRVLFIILVIYTISNFLLFTKIYSNFPRLVHDRPDAFWFLLIGFQPILFHSLIFINHYINRRGYN